MIVKNKMNHGDIKQAIICAPNEFRRALKELSFKDDFNNCCMGIYRKGLFIETHFERCFYKYSNIIKIYCVYNSGSKWLCIRYLDKRLELIGYPYSGNGSNQDVGRSEMLDNLVILLEKYWKAYNTK